MNKRAIGLELTDRIVYLVEIYRHKSQITVSRWQKVELPLGIIDSGELINISFLQQIIFSLLKRKLFGTQIPLYVGISGVQAFTRKLILPRVSLRELKQIIRWEGENILPQPIEEVIYNYQIIGQSVEEYQVLFSALPKKRLNQYFRLFDQSSMAVECLTLNSFGLINFLEYFTELEEYSGVIARVLDDVSDYVFILHGQIELFRTVTLRDLSQQKSKVEVFVFELIATLEHYQSLHDVRFDKGLFMGSEEMKEGICLQMPTFHWSPVSLLAFSSLIENLHALQLTNQCATALGLALLGVN